MSQNQELKSSISSDESAASLVLSDDDVRELLHNPSADSRVALTGRLTTTYTQTQMSPTEGIVAEQIFRLLMRDVEVRVRACLATNIKESSSIPKDIVMELARDVEEVALPVLEYSQVLQDEDLVELIQGTKESAHHLAISRRSNVSGQVADTLLDVGNATVAASLAHNDGAELSENSYKKMMDRFPGDNQILEGLSGRAQLPVAVAEKLMSAVSDTLAQELKKKISQSSAKAQTKEVQAAIEAVAQESVKEIDKAVDKAVDTVKENETLDMLSSAKSQDEIEQLVAQLIAFDRLSPSLILRALCNGNFTFFETSLARLANVPVANAHKLIKDRGDLGFRAIYNKSGLPDAMFPAVKLLNRVVNELSEEGVDVASGKYSNRIVERILQHSEETPVENLSYIIALIRRVAQ